MKTNGVEIMIRPGFETPGYKTTLDFDASEKALEKLKNRAQSWDLVLFNKTRIVGRIKFKAYQFLADGILRRTISVTKFELQSKRRAQEVTEATVAQLIFDTVQKECDKAWGKIDSVPVFFTEDGSSDAGLIGFLKKLGELFFGTHDTMNHQGVVVMGDDITIQLIREHLQRAA